MYRQFFVLTLLYHVTLLYDDGIYHSNSSITMNRYVFFLVAGVLANLR